jgi:hypothetical protein
MTLCSSRNGNPHTPANQRSFNTPHTQRNRPPPVSHIMASPNPRPPPPASFSTSHGTLRRNYHAIHIFEDELGDKEPEMVKVLTQDHGLPMGMGFLSRMIRSTEISISRRWGLVRWVGRLWFSSIRVSLRKSRRLRRICLFFDRQRSDR